MRDARELTQEELAERSRIHRIYLSDIERGVCNITIILLQAVIGVDTIYSELITLPFRLSLSPFAIS